MSLIFLILYCSERRLRELRAAAADVIAARRRPTVANLSTQNAKDGVFQWVGGKVKAGTRNTLVYNTRSGPLSFTDSVRVHVGYDGWFNKEKQVSEGNCCPVKCKLHSQHSCIQVLLCLLGGKTSKLR